MMQDMKKHKNRKQKRMRSRKMRNPTENQEKNTRKKEKRKNPKGENVRNTSIILHLVMTVQTTALIQMSNIQKVSTKKELVSTGIMTFHFLSMDIYQEAT
uniref:Zinc finger CCCH-type containing 6 n=1 Tax=Molossus molossus TaxID=27622 RepID=A0A7J8E5N2_MOLMO|nr:zinc finger CCCH-type containing 6 [Molossus molossus]